MLDPVDLALAEPQSEAENSAKVLSIPSATGIRQNQPAECRFGKRRSRQNYVFQAPIAN
jgi:hypothetical protein